MAKGIPMAVLKGMRVWLDDHPSYVPSLGIPGISAMFIDRNNKSKKEVTYESLMAYYKQSQGKKGKAKQRET